MSLASSFGIPLRWRKRSQQPPIPYVEEETDSLSRELDGSSRRGELPGYEGAKARGTVDQSTLIEDIETPSAPKKSSNVEERSPKGPRSSGSSVNQSVPKTDRKESKENRQPAGESQSQGSGKPSHRSPTRSQDMPSTSQPLKPAHTQSSHPPKSSPLPDQKLISRQAEPGSKVPGHRENPVPPKSILKPTPEVSQKNPTASTRSPSLHRGSEHHKSASPSRHAQPEPIRNAEVRTSSSARPKPAEKTQSVPSLNTSVRGQDQYKSASPTKHAQPEPIRSAEARTTSSARPRTTEQTKHVPSLNTSVRGQDQYKSSSPTRHTQPESSRSPSVKTTAPVKTIPEMTEKPQTFSSRNSPQFMEQSKHKSSSPARYAPLETVRPEKPASSVRERSQTAPSRASSLPHGQEQHRSSSPTRYDHPERVQRHVRTASSPKRTADVLPQPQTVMSRAPSVRQDRTEHRVTATSMPPPIAGYPSVLVNAFPPNVPGVAQNPQSFPTRPVTVPLEFQNMPPPTIPYQPAPAQSTYVRGPPPPPKELLEATRQAQPMVPRPLPTPPDDEPRKPRPSSIAYQPNTVVGNSGVRVEMLPPRSVPDFPQNYQQPPLPVENIQYKSFSSSIGPPPPDTPPTPQANPFQTVPVWPVTTHPLSNPPTEKPYIPASSAMKEPTSASQTRSAKTPTADPHSGRSYETAAPRHDHVTRPVNASPVRSVEKSLPSSSGPSVAERLEEKIKHRREQRDYGETPREAAHPRSEALRTSNSPASQSPERRGRSTQPPGAWPSDTPSDSSSSRLTQFPDLEPTTGDAKPQDKPLKSALRSQSLDRSRSASVKAARRRTVAFAGTPIEYPSQALVKVNNETALAQLQSEEYGSDSSRSSSPNTGLTLSPCPRSVPVAGYQDWYTIEGLGHLDVCPSCVKQMRKSKFRDRLVLRTSRRTEPIRCAMSEPWTRLAWMQTLKKKLETLDLLLEVTRPSNTQGTKSCTGRIINEQYWYRLTDPDTKMFLPQFNICSACVRNIRLLMPAHRETFQRSTTSQERVCDLVTDSPRFIRYIDALDLSSNRADQEDASPDLKEFLTYARRKVVLRDCRRSGLLIDKWHYMSQLPEFTVCEDCYDDIVWPLSKARHPIAREFSSVMRVLPGDRGRGGRDGNREASCQLYSPRIRAKFNDAVKRDDMSFLKWMAVTRYEAEQRFRDRQDELLADQRRGYECSDGLRRNLEDWKRYE